MRSVLVSPRQRTPIIKVIFRAFMRLLLAGIITLLLLVVLMWFDHYRPTSLPVPSGPFAVGRICLIWRDTGNVDVMAPIPGTDREVVAWLWYPAAKRVPSHAYAPYLPAAWRKAIEKQRGVLMGDILTRDLSKVYTHSIADAPLSPLRSAYPVVLLRAGLAALVTNYTALAEDLASHGYVVVGVDAPYRSSVVVLPDKGTVLRSPENDADRYSGKQKEQIAVKLLHAWSKDMSYALDRLTQLNIADPSGRFRCHLDLKHIGIVGHSLGGATALQFCLDDPRCKAGIDIDGAPLSKVLNGECVQPFMFLIGDHSNEPDQDVRQVLANIRKIYEKIPEDRRYWLTLNGAGHFGFTDDGALLKSPVIMHILRFLGIVKMDGRRQLEITSAYTSMFFDVYLNGAPPSVFKNKLDSADVK